MPSPENTYVTVETKCPDCKGKRTVERAMHNSTSTRTEACNNCGATGYLPQRISLLDMADLIVKLLTKLPSWEALKQSNK